MSLADLLDAAPRDPRRIAGVTVGIVEDNEDPENLARVRVTLPQLGEQPPSTWARVVTPAGGGDRGFYALPEVGDEVLVAFAQGDIDYPYVVGSLWSTADPPPENNADGDNRIRKFKSRIGHEVIFDDDESGSEARVEVRSAGGHCITLSDASGGAKIEIVDSGGQNSVVLDGATGTVTIQAGTKIELKAPQIEAVAQGTMKLEASGLLEAKGALIKLN